MFTPKQIEAIAALKSHPGYQTLMAVFNDYIKALQKELLLANNEFEERTFLAKWRAAEDLQRVFGEYVEHFAKEPEGADEETTPVNPLEFSKIRALADHYEQLIKDNEE